MYAYRPKRKNTRAALLIAALTVIAAVGFLFAAVSEEAPYIVEFIALSATAVAVLVAGRYLLREYVYAVEPRGTDFDFVVTELCGKRHKAVCRVGVSDISEIVRETPENKRALLSRSKGMKRFDYCVDLGASDACYLFLEEEGKHVAIRFSPDGRMEALLRSFVPSSVYGDGTDP